MEVIPIDSPQFALSGLVMSVKAIWKWLTRRRTVWCQLALLCVDARTYFNVPWSMSVLWCEKNVLWEMKWCARRKFPLVINIGNSSPKISDVLASYWCQNDWLSVKINQNYQEILRVSPVDIRTALAGGIEFLEFFFWIQKYRIHSNNWYENPLKWVLLRKISDTVQLPYKRIKLHVNFVPKYLILASCQSIWF